MVEKFDEDEGDFIIPEFGTCGMGTNEEEDEVPTKACCSTTGCACKEEEVKLPPGEEIKQEKPGI
jgi:hypothetical protein